MFATHYSYTWLYNDPPFEGTATWDTQQTNPPDPITGFVDFTNPKGQAFAQWSMAVGASTTYGQVFPIDQAKRDFDAVNAAQAQQWLYWDNAGTNTPLHYTFNTPVGATDAQTCGRVLFSDFHVANGNSAGPYPAECDQLGTTLSPQEHLLEFMLFDLASCITPTVPPPPPSCTPKTCMEQGFTCGPQGDGCGNVLACGGCTAPETCGGGGTPGVCGGMPCAPVSCATQGIECGPAGDGCGGLLQCGDCPNGETCGGGGVTGMCGKPICTPTTCTAQGFNCGPAGDGCGGVLLCGSCPPGQTCGAGQPGKCGLPDAGTCAPLTCMSQGIECGPAGDGCGNQLDCGNCPRQDLRRRRDARRLRRSDVHADHLHGARHRLRAGRRRVRRRHPVPRLPGQPDLRRRRDARQVRLDVHADHLHGAGLHLRPRGRRLRRARPVRHLHHARHLRRRRCTGAVRPLHEQLKEERPADGKTHGAPASRRISSSIAPAAASRG